ncbi:MAG: toll/interleukin-1 receptor domain-containing protein [Gemmataceae bacterium]|nr:toll/interleukin-1 receptor domain-containing protein [Gemmataceae bacterium]
MKPGERLELIKAVAARLAEKDWREVDVTLRTFKLPWADSWRDGGIYEYALDMLLEGEDSSLLELQQYLCRPQGGANPSPHGTSFTLRDTSDGPWQSGLFRAFLSHDTRDKKNVSELKAWLERYAVDPFVAHEDIEPTTEWLAEIRRRLETCDAVIAYLTPRFHESKWTDQEVGYCLGRGIPVIPIRLGEDPYGLMMPYQGIQGLARGADQLAGKVFEILVSRPQTQGRMAEAVVTYFEGSASWSEAKRRVGLLEKVEVWTPGLLGRLEAAVEQNKEIKEAFGVPGRLKALANKHAR